MKKIYRTLILFSLFSQLSPVLAQNHSNGVDFVYNGVTYPDFTYAGIRRGSGQVGIPNVTGPIFNVNSFDKAGIDAAVAQAAAAGGGVVYLKAGTYNLSGPVNITADNIVIRGAGRTSTIVKLNAASGSNVGAFNFTGGGAGTGWAPTANAARGSRTMTLPSTHTLQPGDLAYLEITTVPDVYLNKSKTQNSNGRFHRTVQLVKAVNGSTITFNQPLRVDYLTSKGVNVRKVDPIKRCGVEDLRLEATANFGGGVHGIRFAWGYECWTDNVHIYRPSSWSIRYEYSKYCEARNSIWENPWNKGGGGQGYGGPIGAYDCLLDNITMIDMRHAPNFQDESNGNVFRNSTATGSDMQFHAGFCTENLIENVTVNQGSSSMSYAFWTNHISSFLSPGAGPRNVLWNNDLSWGGRGIWFGGFNNDWVVAYNRLRSGGAYDYSYLVQISDQINGIKLIGNRFAIANNGGDGGVWFLPGWSSSSVDVGGGISYSPTIVNGDTLKSTAKNIEFINNTFYGVPAGKRWNLSHMQASLNPNLDQGNVWNATYDPATPPARPTPPMASLYAWQLSQIAAPGNSGPSVSITSPTNNSTVAPGSTVTINASASDSDGTVSSVKFYVNDALVSTDTDGSNGWSYSYAVGSTTGTRTLHAVATDNDAATGTSSDVILNVGTSTGNVAPTASLTAPSGNISIPAGSPYTLQATASDSDGTVTKVGFYANGNLLGEDTTSPYSFSWTPAAGTYTITARATDNDAATGTSASRTVTVTSGTTSNLVFSENMWEGTTPTANGSISTHETNNRFQNDQYTMTGTGTTSNAETSTGYTGASGSWNISLNYASDQTFQISNISTSGVSGLQLSFGVRKSSTTSDGSTLDVQVSSDGTNWTTLTVPALPTGTGTASWHYVTASGSIPATSNLRIRFINNGTASVYYRIDDVKLTYSSGTLMTSANTNSLSLIEESTQSSSKSSLQVYPNPTTGIVNLQWNGKTAGDFSVLTLDGRKVKQGKLSGNTSQAVDLTGLSKGVYLIRVTDSTESFTQKIILE